MELSNILKQVRIEVGMTQVELATALHLSFSTINRWENGRARPNRLASVTLLTQLKEKGASQESLSKLENALFDRKASGRGVS
ncbi:MAG: helix-turn-helix transcriptional regulator [Clostridia bacterium]